MTRARSLEIAIGEQVRERVHAWPMRNGVDEEVLDRVSGDVDELVEEAGARWRWGGCRDGRR